MGTGYVFLESFADRTRFPKKLSETSGLPARDERISLHACMTWMHSTFFVEEALKVSSNRTHRDPIFNSVIPDRGSRSMRRELR